MTLQTAFAYTYGPPNLSSTSTSTTVTLTGSGYTPGGSVRIEMVYKGNSGSQTIGNNLVVWTGTASPNNRVCFGFPFPHCIGDPGGKINVTLNLSDLAIDISNDPMVHPPVNPCASTTSGDLVAVDNTEEAQGNFDGYGWSNGVSLPPLPCLLPIPHFP